MSTVKISAAAAVSTLDDSHMLPLGNVGNSEANKVTVATLAQYAAKYCSDINVVYHNGNYNYNIYSVDLVRYLTTYYSYEPLGLELVNCAHPLIVSLTEPDEATMYWASQSGGTGTYTTTRKAAVMDFDGETNTSNIISNCTYANAEGYAPYYCNNFSCISESDGWGIGAGCWWLPSVGELRMIMTKFTAINTALSLISATSKAWTTTQLQRVDGYWSSTEASAPNAWVVSFKIGGVSSVSKASSSYRVRPVSIFQESVTA